MECNVPRSFLSLFFVLLTTYSSGLFAHTVSFKGAHALNFANSEDMSMWTYNYSMTPKNSIGANYYRFELPGKTERFYFLEANFLLKRWNELSSQGNLYLSLGQGLSESNSQYHSDVAIEADWETRKYYTAFKTQGILNHKDSSKNIYYTKYRVGFAPYLAEFDQINTWIILETKYVNKMKEEFSVTPFVRLFYQNFLMEIGISNKGSSEFNFMVHI